MNRFECKVVIVTGNGSGISAGTARRFLQEGALVVLNGRHEHKLHETIAGFDAAKSFVHPGDVPDEEYVKRLVADTIAKFGKLDVLGAQFVQCGKGAVTNFTRSRALEYGSRGVRINAVAPSLTSTGATPMKSQV